MSLVEKIEAITASSHEWRSDIAFPNSAESQQFGLSLTEQIVYWYYSEKVKLWWWLEIIATASTSAYYFGPFLSAKAAELAKPKYVEVLKLEGAEEISVQIKQYQPKNLNHNCEVLPPLYCQLLDEAMPVVLEEIENALEVYPDEACRKFFAAPEWHQKLTAYVLSRIPAVYTIRESLQIASRKPKFPLLSLELRLRLEKYIYRGIKQIFQSSFDSAIG